LTGDAAAPDDERIDMSALHDRRPADFEYPEPFARSLEEELAGVLRDAGLEGRQAQAVSNRLGWSGRPATTLAEAAAREGYSRERVRQLEVKVRRHAEESPLRLPLTAAALRLVENAAPIARDRIPGELARAGLSAGPFDPSGLLSAAELGRLDLRVCERDGILMQKRHLELVAGLEKAAQTIVKKVGAGTVEAVARRSGDDAAPQAAQRLLDAHADVIWLDDTREWFFVRGTRTPFTRTLRKMLSVSGSLTLADVDDGLRRAFRPICLPRPVLLRLCRLVPWLAVEDEPPAVTATIAVDEARVLSTLERALVGVFREHGPMLTFSKAVALGEEQGLNPSSVGLYLCRSPIIKTISRGRYTLRGAELLSAV
jgi:hypothetical protein